MSSELRIVIKPVWTEMVNINQESYEFLQSADLPAPAIDTFTMVACELVENAIKYGDNRGEKGDDVILHVAIAERSITVDVANHIGRGSRHHLRQLDQTLQWVRGFQDPSQAYMERVREISREPADHGKSGLGIVRIAYEARAAIDFVVGEDSTLSVSAVAKIGS